MQAHKTAQGETEDTSCGVSLTCRVTSKTLTTALVLFSKTPMIASSLQGTTGIYSCKGLLLVNL